MADLYALLRNGLAGLRVLLAATVVCGLAYSLLVTGVAQTALGWRADGSLVTSTGARTRDADGAVGSALLGQSTTSRRLFLPRPSAAGDGYDPRATAASNLGPNSSDLLREVAERRREVADREQVPVTDVPADAVTSSASGLDPDISPAYAALQVPRVARENDLPVALVRRLVAEHTSDRSWGFLGAAHVDVLGLDIAVESAADDR